MLYKKQNEKIFSDSIDRAYIELVYTELLSIILECSTSSKLCTTLPMRMERVVKDFMCPAVEFELDRIEPSKVSGQRNNTIRFWLWKCYCSGSMKNLLELKKTGVNKLY